MSQPTRQQTLTTTASANYDFLLSLHVDSLDVEPTNIAMQCNALQCNPFLLAWLRACCLALRAIPCHNVVFVSVTTGTGGPAPGTKFQGCDGQTYRRNSGGGIPDEVGKPHQKISNSVGTLSMANTGTWCGVTWCDTIQKRQQLSIVGVCKPKRSVERTNERTVTSLVSERV